MNKLTIINVREFGWLGNLEETKKKYPYEMYHKKDVELAVEQLKKEIRKVRKISHPISNYDLFILIDKIFQIGKQESGKK